MIPLERVPVVHESDDAANALWKLAGEGVGRALVMRDDRLAGLLSLSDIADVVRRRDGP